MQVHHKGAYKSSLDSMELRHKEGDRSILEPLSIWHYFWYSKLPIQSGPKSSQSGLYLWYSKLPIQSGSESKSNLDTMELHHKELDRSSLDPMELHHKEGDRSSLKPLSFGITSGTRSYQSSLDLNPVWIQCKCIIKEPTNPVWIQCQCTIKEMANPVWI